MPDPVEIVGMASVGYALVLNASYLLLWPLAHMGITARVREREWSWYEEAFRSPATPPVSVIVPARNEEAVVLESVRSILGQEYPRLELVLVDDGSSDATAATVIAEYGLGRVAVAPRGAVSYQPVVETWQSDGDVAVTLVRKHNGGRADAVNCGIDHARYEHVCITDADSILDPAALAVMVRPFLEDPARVVAVGGTIRVGNSGRIEHGRMIQPRVPARVVAGCQLVEYLRAFLLGRSGWDRLGALMIVSGAFGMFRRDVLEDAGGYWTQTVGEDLEMTLRLHRHLRDRGSPYRIVYNADPVCWTEVPADLGTLGHQRRRWHRGLWESLWRHRRMMLRPRYGVLGMLGLPYMLVIEFLGPVFVAAAWIAFPFGLATGRIDPWVVALWVCVQSLFGTLVTLAACALEERGYRYYHGARDLARMVFLAVVENLFFRQAVDAYRLVGIADIVRGERSWGRMQRHGLADS